MLRPSVVIDIGSGFTKMGLSGGTQPQFVIPTCVARPVSRASGQYVGSQACGDDGQDYYIGEVAQKKSKDEQYLLQSPVKNGRIENWDDIELFLLESVFKKMRVIPEEHMFCMTEPPFNTPENRELMAEIMFELFNVNGLHFNMGAVLALYAHKTHEDLVRGATRSASQMDLSGIVVDSGDSLTQVIPVSQGYLISSCVQEVPLGGKHVDQFVFDSITARKEPVPADCRMEAARTIKEEHSYLCRDVIDEYEKFDKDSKKFKTVTGMHPTKKEQWSITAGYERFLAPEIFFNPEIVLDRFTTPLHIVVDECVQKCPLDCRRQLYENVVLAGGSTSFTHFRERFERDLQCCVAKRLKQYELTSGAKSKDIAVKVSGGSGGRGSSKVLGRYAAWIGGSLLAGEPHFERMCKLKKDYDEIGPQCMRGVTLHG